MTTTEMTETTAEAVADTMTENVTNGQVLADKYAPDGILKIGDTIPLDLYQHAGHIGTCSVRCAGAPGLHGAYGYCQRAEGHDRRLPHFVADENRVVTWTWFDVVTMETTETIRTTPTAELDDPADAKVDEFVVGARVNQRNKRDILVVLSTPRRRDPSVEILDLTHSRFRKLTKTSLVPPRPDDPDPTPEQIQWLGEFLAKRRNTCREIAQREVRNQRWSRAQMNESLRRIGIAEELPTYGAELRVTVKLKAPNGKRAGDYHVVDWAQATQVLADKLPGLEIDGLTVVSARITGGGQIGEVNF